MQQNYETNECWDSRKPWICSFRRMCFHVHVATSTHASYRTDRLAARLRKGEVTIAFDKDDPDALDFVTASANLRSFAYGIQLKSKWEVKGHHCPRCVMYMRANYYSEMAGNIIPAFSRRCTFSVESLALQALVPSGTCTRSSNPFSRWLQSSHLRRTRSAGFAGIRSLCFGVILNVHCSETLSARHLGTAMPLALVAQASAKCPCSRARVYLRSRTGTTIWTARSATSALSKGSS
jgi:hypothetical protein